MLADDKLRIEDEPRPEDVAALDDRLYRHNAAVTGCDDGRWLAIFVRDGTGDIVAGLILVLSCRLTATIVGLAAIQRAPKGGRSHD